MQPRRTRASSSGVVERRCSQRHCLRPPLQPRRANGLESTRLGETAQGPGDRGVRGQDANMPADRAQRLGVRRVDRGPPLGRSTLTTPPDLVRRRAAHRRHQCVAVASRELRHAVCVALAVIGAGAAIIWFVQRRRIVREATVESTTSTTLKQWPTAKTGTTRCTSGVGRDRLISAQQCDDLRATTCASRSSGDEAERGRVMRAVSNVARSEMSNTAALLELRA